MLLFRKSEILHFKVSITNMPNVWDFSPDDRWEGYAAQRSELQHTRSLPEEEAVVDAANVLVWGADTAVAELDDDTCAEAIEHLCDRAVEAGCYGDVRKQREREVLCRSTRLICTAYHGSNRRATPSSRARWRRQPGSTCL